MPYEAKLVFGILAFFLACAGFGLLVEYLGERPPRISQANINNELSERQKRRGYVPPDDAA